MNIIVGQGIPPLPELEEIGVSLVSLGPRPMRAAPAPVREIARELLDTGTYTRMMADTMSYSQINRMFERDARGYCTRET